MYYSYISLGFETNLQISLKGESSFWIITRSNEALNEYSAIVKITKEDKSQKMFISMGTFVKDCNNNEVFKIFQKQQLIDSSSNLIEN